MMTSHGGGSERIVNMEVVALLERFKSALSTLGDERYAIAYSDILVHREGKETIVSNFRERMTTRLVDKMRLLNNPKIDEEIERVAEQLAGFDGEKKAEIIKKAKMAKSRILELAFQENIPSNLNLITLC